MTTPSTNLTFSAVQAELGGSNPISLSEYVRGGSIVNTNQTSPNGTIPASLSNISMGVFRSVTRYVAIGFTGGSFDNNIAGNAFGNPCSLVLTFTSIGTITTFGTGAYGWDYAPTGFVTGGNTTGLSIRLQASWSANGVPSVVLVVFGVTVNIGAGTYDSGYVSFGGVDKVIRGTSNTLSKTLALTGIISITDGTNTITSSLVHFDLQV